MKKFGSTSRRREKGATGIGFINMGTSLLLVVFVVLCLVVFAVLSISTAQADYNLSSNQAELTSQYYEACNAAEELLAVIDDAATGGADGEKIAEMLGATTVDQDREDATDAAGAGGTGKIEGAENSVVADGADDVSSTDETGGHTISGITYDAESDCISFAVEVNESQILDVVVHLTGADDAGSSGGLHYYEIQTWELASSTEWKADSNTTMMSFTS